MTAGVAVAQLGARMHYAVPNLLHASGDLARLYTDGCASVGFPRYLSVIPAVLRPTLLRRMLDRRPDVPPERITSFTTFGWSYALRRRRAATRTELTRTHLHAGTSFCQRILAAGFPAGTAAVYGFNSASLELFESPQARGMAKILEQTIAPYESEREILAREAQRHPGLEMSGLDDALAGEFSARERREWALADAIFCGSEFVRDMIARAGGPVGRCVVVPYGIAVPQRNEGRTVRASGALRVLTVGAVGLRKGSYDVFAAAKALGRDAQFRMVGLVTLPAETMAAMRGEVDVTGPIPRSEIPAAFAWADVFLLPSLCEGSATVTYEALAAGLPVVCTPNTGSVVRDGVDGRIVPVGDVEAIVETLRELSADHALLARMGENAARRAREFDLPSYKSRLTAAIREALGK